MLQSTYELYQKLMEAEAQLASGLKPLTVEEVFDGLREKYGLDI